jgi:xylulose-5-phosphate/fructose-6-phosphate phosphoketolase
MARSCLVSFCPGGIPSNLAPETPGSSQEGGELSHALAHVHGAAFDNPGQMMLCAVADGEAETAGRRLALEKIPQPRRRGTYRTSPQRIQDRQPPLLALIAEGELAALMRVYR